MAHLDLGCLEQEFGGIHRLEFWWLLLPPHLRLQLLRPDQAVSTEDDLLLANGLLRVRFNIFDTRRKLELSKGLLALDVRAVHLIKALLLVKVSVGLQIHIDWRVVVTKEHGRRLYQVWVQ